MWAADIDPKKASQAVSEISARYVAHAKQRHLCAAA